LVDFKTVKLRNGKITVIRQIGIEQV